MKRGFVSSLGTFKLNAQRLEKLALKSPGMLNNGLYMNLKSPIFLAGTFTFDVLK